MTVKIPDRPPYGSRAASSLLPYGAALIEAGFGAGGLEERAMTPNDATTTMIALLTPAERLSDLHVILGLDDDCLPELDTTIWPPAPEAYGARAGAVAWLLSHAPIALIESEEEN